MLTIGIYVIQYNRQERAWEVTGEETPHRFQTGAIGKRAAIKFAIHKAFPKLAEAVERFSAKRDNASGRAWEAAQLLIGGHVLEPGSQAGSNCLAQVMSQQNGRYPPPYQLCQQADKLTCTCADYEAGGVVVDGQSFCKHGLAYLLGLYLNWPLQPAKAESLPPVVRLRREAGGRWRGRTVIRVNSPLPGRAMACSQERQVVYPLIPMVNQSAPCITLPMPVLSLSPDRHRLTTRN